MGAPISDFANTPFATVMARVARVVGDGSDSDRAPDFLPASGEIVFTPNIKFSKLEVDNKSVIVLNEPVRCTIDPVTGYMIGPDGGFGVRLVASSGVNIEPQGLGYTVTFRGAETRIPDFSIFLEAGSVVDLAKILPVDLQPGIVTTVSSKTVDAVEQALIRLNSLQENVSYTVKSIPDMFRWDGTTLLINGNPGPDLGRITDEKLEEVNNTIDSLAQAHSDLMTAYVETAHSFVELDGKLGQAFPDDIFDVNLAIEQAKDLATTADGKADTAISDASTAQARADEALEKYGPLDQRTIIAQAAADVAQARADEARRLALAADENLLASWGLDAWEPGEGWWIDDSLIGTGWRAEPGALTSTRVVTLWGGRTYEVRLDGSAPEGALYVDTKPSGGSWVEQGRFEPGDLNPQQVRVTPTSPFGYYNLRFRMVPHEGDTEIFRIELFDVTGLAEVETGVDAAMTMASGKNAVSYTDVANSVAEPGPTPSTASGAGRRKYDMHRNRRTNGQIIGEWMWTGTAWTRLALSDAMLSSLDVGKLTAGTANIQTAVINKVWGQLGVFDKLDVRTDAYISGTNLKNGAVTARTLNVVPEMGQGGLQLTPDGMMLIDSEGSGTVDLRVNAENYLSFYHDNATSFSVSADGALAAQNVSANDGLFYRGIELTEFLEAMPRGIVYFAEQIDGVHTISNASYTSRIGHIVVERPSTPRHWRIVARAGIQSSSSGGNDTSGAHWQFVSNTGSHYNQDSWKVLASVLYQTSGYYWQTETLEQVVNTDDISWNTSGTALVSWTARNAIGASYKLGQGAIFYIEDMGPAFDRSPTYPWIRPTASGDTGSSTTPTSRTGTWNMSSFQNYRAGVRVNHASGNIAGGNYSGEWRGIMFFPHATIKSALSGATTTKVEIYLQNAHTYAYSGSTILIGSHNYASAPSSSPSVAARTSQHFSRGQGRWVTLPTAVGDGFKNGTIKGLAVYGSSTANYATWTPSAPKLRITYKK